MESFQAVFGTEVLWFFFQPVGPGSPTVLDDVYDEGAVASGKTYDGPLRIPVLSAVPAQGAENPDDQGFATYDRIVLRMSYEQVRRAGLSQNLIQDRESRLLDRFVYRSRVFDVTALQTSGHFEQTGADTVLQVSGVQLRPDELLDSPTFARYSG